MLHLKNALEIKKSLDFFFVHDSLCQIEVTTILI